MNDDSDNNEDNNGDYEDMPSTWPRYFNSVPWHISHHMHEYLFKKIISSEDVKSHDNVISINDWLEKRGFERY